MSRILVVDDTRTARRVVRGILSDNCYEFIEAKDGCDALERLEESVPDVVISDLVMPGMDGLELVSIARVRYPNVPVILMTSHGSEKIA